MRILVVSQYFWPENFPIINDLVIELEKRNHQVVVLTGKPNYPQGIFFPEFKKNPEKYNFLGKSLIIRVPIMARKNSLKNLFYNYLSFVISCILFGVYRLRKCSFDIVFVYAPSPITVAIPSILLGRIKNAPVILWVQDLWPESLFAVAVVKNKLVLNLISKLVTFIYDKCHLLLGQSNGFVESIQANCSNKNKVKFFPNWAKFPACLDMSIPASEIKKIDSSFDILFAGNIGEAQDFPTILSAMEALKSNKLIRLWVMGEGRRRNWLEIEIQRRGLSDTVFLLAPSPVERMPCFYKASDALLVPLRSSPIFSMTIPSKIQSCMAAGLPILGILDGEGARLITHSGVGFVCGSGNIEGLVQNATRMFEMNVADRVRMGLSGQKFAEEEFNMVKLIDKLLVWCDEVLKIQSNY